MESSRRHSNRLAVALLAATATVTVAACAAEPEDDASTPTDPASTAPTSSSDSDVGPVRIGYISQEKELLSIVEAREAAEAGVAYVNAELGGVDGHPLEMEVCPVGDSPESAVACAQQFVNDESVVMVITSTYSDPTVLGITSEAGLPTIGTSTTPLDWQVPAAWSFDAGVPSLVQGATVFLSETLAASSTVFLCADDPGVLELCEIGAELFGELGVEVDQIVPVSLEQADYTGTIAAAGIDGIDAVTVVLDRSQCLPVAEALALADASKPVLSFDACLRPELLTSAEIDGWYEMVASALPTASEDPAVLEGQRILDTYAEEPNPSGFAAYGLAAAVGSAIALDAVPNAELTRATADAALGEFSTDFGWYPPIGCPGPDPFPGACVQQVTVIQADGGSIELVDQIDVDVTVFEALL